MHGNITALTADGVGRITLDDGREIRFGLTACVDVSPTVGLDVFVSEVVPHPLGGEKAKAVHANAAGRFDRFTLARMKEELDVVLRDKLLSALGRLLPENDCNVPTVAETLADCGAVSFALDAEQLAVDTLLAWAPFDPCFVAFEPQDGDALGLYVHPPTLARVPQPPVVRFGHETHEIDPPPLFAPWLRPFLPFDREPLDEALVLMRAGRWPQTLIVRAEAQLQLLLANEHHHRERERIELQHYREHPDVYAEALRAHARRR